MNLKYLAAAGAASLLMAGAVYAQPSGSGSPAAGAATGQVNPPTASPSTSGSATTGTSTSTTSTGVTTSSTTTSADVAGSNASVTTSTITNGPVPDTAENRRKYGGPMSHAGKRTAAKGN
jgi:hypothetical protein